MINSKVDYRFKILYALGMIFVVAGHCKNGGVSLLYDWFSPYAFHLGLFMFSSGYFYKEENEARAGAYIIKKAKRLLIPLYLWNLFYGVLILVLNRFGFTIGGDFTLRNLLLEPILTGHQFEYNLGGWSVIPLFMVQVYNVLARKLLSFLKVKNEWCYFVLAMAEGIGGVYLANMGYNEGWWLVLVRFLYFIPFYELGVLYKKKLEQYDRVPHFWYFAFIFFAQLIIMLHYGRKPYYTPSWCNDFTEGPVLPFVVGFLGIALWLRIAILIEKAIGTSKYISLIADHTFSIMINQFLGFMAVNGVLSILKKVTPYCQGFNEKAFHTDLWYLYTPRKIGQFKIVYLVAGLAVPIVMQIVVTKGWRTIRKFVTAWGYGKQKKREER